MNNQQHSLKIVKTETVSPKNVSLVVLMYILIITVPAIWLWFNRYEVYHGEEKLKLLYDAEQMQQAPMPFSSSWGEPVYQLQTYRPNVWDNETFHGILLTMYTWIKLWWILLSLYEWLLHYLYKYTQGNDDVILKGWFIFFVFSFIFSLLITFSIDTIFSIAYLTLKRIFIDWLDRSVVDTTSYFRMFYHKKDTFGHPFTFGWNAPFFLIREYRYLKEDVQFECLYSVESETLHNVIYKSSWWKKNGVPIVADNRIFVNVSITPKEPSVQFFSPQKFIIHSTLTIILVKEEDFGTYTCDYYNPMMAIVEPSILVDRESEKAPPKPKQTAQQQPQPMSPHPHCGCKPSSTSLHAHDKTCFAEFELMKFPEKEHIISIQISPGGIIYDQAFYWTVAPEDEIHVDIAADELNDFQKSPECCSIFIKLYWLFFKGGFFYDMPFSRLFKSNNFIHVTHWKCVCHSSYGFHNYTFLRNYFNSDTDAWEVMEIEFPIKLFLEATNHNTVALADSLPFCMNGNNDTTICRALDILLRNSVYTMYTYDLVITIFIFVVYFLCSKFLDSFKYSITIPLRRISMHIFTPLPGYFDTIKGQPLRIARKIKNNMQPPSDKYDIYISYSDADEYATHVAEYMRSLFLDTGLKVFDPNYDILPGQMTNSSICTAIESSHRFIILASQAYLEDRRTTMEFSCIGDLIVSQQTKPKDRLLVILLEECAIRGLPRAACIRVPHYMKDNFQLDEASASRVKEWDLQTRPWDALKESQWHRFITKLRLCGFGWKSLIVLGSLILIALRSSVFVSYEETSSYLDDLMENDFI